MAGINNIGSLLPPALTDQNDAFSQASSIAASVNSVSDARALAAMAEEDSFESKLRSAMTTQNDAELKDACQQFEELMLGILYKSMKATIQRSELVPESPGSEIYEQWQDEALMKKISERGTFGLADMMYKQLTMRMKNAYEIIEDDPVDEAEAQAYRP